ncbi:MAG: hypothetical protein J6Y32_03045 [Bacteroidales bacterium]|nr:hypothetical protein [Bacteroidales bacterium]
MKKTLFFFLAGLVLASCAKSADPAAETVADPAGETMTIFAGIPEDAFTEPSVSAEGATRLSVSDAGIPSWQTGDQIALYNGTGFVTFTLADASTGAFSGPAGTYTLAVYPAVIADSVNGEGELILNLPAVYGWASDCTNAPMVGLIENGECTFYSMGGLFKFTFSNIPETVNALHFASSGRKITGTFNVGVPDPGNTVIPLENAETDAEKAVSFSLPASHASTMTFYVPVPLFDDTFTISLSSDDGIPSAELSTTISVARRQMRRYKSQDCAASLPDKIFLIGGCMQNDWTFSENHVLVKGENGVYTGTETITTGGEDWRGFKMYMGNDWGATWLSIDEENSSYGNLIPYGGEAYKAAHSVADTQVYPSVLGYEDGTYDITLDLINKTMTMTPASEPEEDPWLSAYYLSGDIFDPDWGWPSPGTVGLTLQKQAVGIYTCTTYLYLDHSNRSFKFWEDTNWGGEYKFSGTYNSSDHSFGIVKGSGDPAFMPYDYGYQASGYYEIRVDFKQMKLFLSAVIN